MRIPDWSYGPDERLGIFGSSRNARDEAESKFVLVPSAYHILCLQRHVGPYRTHHFIQAV